jgi:hypothetical protein
MKKQYYTPRLKEFKTGFRYEHYIPSKEVWAKETFYLNEKHINIINYVDIQTENTLLKVRVRHLDHDDMIEAGWKENENQSPSYCTDYLLGDEWSLDIFDSERGIRIMQFDEIKFFGKIKNYNQLLDVLEMIGIKKE